MNNTALKTVMPVIAVPSVDDTRRFYVNDLGFDHLQGVIGKDGKLDFCTIAKDGAKIMFARTPGGKTDTRATSTKRPVKIYLEVADIEHYFGQINEKTSVKVTEPLTTQWWGDRTFTAQDPNGYELWFYQTVDIPKPPEGLNIV